VATKPTLRLVPSTGEMLKVPGRKPNKEQRTKEYLTGAEVGRLMKAARKGRWGHRDATLVLVMVRDGLRVTEACDLRWDQIDWRRGHLHVRRLKGGIDSVHTLQGDELRALHQLEREQEPKSGFVFTSERGGPMSRFNVNKMIGKSGKEAGIANCHPHMLRHACGHLLADAGHDTRRLQLWLGHSDIKHTARYSELSAKPFKDFWRG
jgi:integrase